MKVALEMRDTLDGREGTRTGRARRPPDREATRNVILIVFNEFWGEGALENRVADVAELEVNDVDMGHQGVPNRLVVNKTLDMLPSSTGWLDTKTVKLPRVQDM